MFKLMLLCLVINTSKVTVHENHTSYFKEYSTSLIIVINDSNIQIGNNVLTIVKKKGNKYWLTKDNCNYVLFVTRKTVQLQSNTQTLYYTIKTNNHEHN